MANFSQIFIMSIRGDTIISRDFRADVPRTAAEVFFRNIKGWSSSKKPSSTSSSSSTAPPIFIVDGVSYLHVRSSGLFYVGTTKRNVSPQACLEFLTRLARVIKDYLGAATEEALRKNFVLVYELLDEMLDLGYPESTATEVLRSFVLNEPIQVAQLRATPGGGFSRSSNSRAPGNAAMKSVIARPSGGGRTREEIFVDVVEKISVTFSAAGYVQTAEIDGSIQVKSFLAGNPEIRLALNEDLYIASSGSNPGGSSTFGVTLEDCNFHEGARLDEFETDKMISMVPPDGEFCLMNYRYTQEFSLPFRLTTHVENNGGGRSEIVLRLRAQYPNNLSANGVEIMLPVAKEEGRIGVSVESGGSNLQTAAEFMESEHAIRWRIKKMPGAAESAIRIRTMKSGGDTGASLRNFGPATMQFLLPMHCPSRLNVRYLQVVSQNKKSPPYRWVRYVCTASSYVIRL